MAFFALIEPFKKWEERKKKITDVFNIYNSVRNFGIVDVGK
jgi:hypothetical protein